MDARPTETECHLLLILEKECRDFIKAYDGREHALGNGKAQTCYKRIRFMLIDLSEARLLQEKSEKTR